MASIVPFIPRGVFDDVATKAMGRAFETACVALHDSGQPQIVHEVMAKRIIRAAQRGERDPAKLCSIALAAFNSDKLMR